MNATDAAKALGGGSCITQRKRFGVDGANARTFTATSGSRNVQEWGGWLGEGSLRKDQDGESWGVKKHYEIQQQVRRIGSN